jgi:hypothetical protein
VHIPKFRNGCGKILANASTPDFSAASDIILGYALIQKRGLILTRIEAAIKDRLENGFKNWNGGYDSWLSWCNTLYDDASIYNVYGHRLTLKQYQNMMGDLFKKQDIKLGKFHNMIIADNWAAIRYDVEVTEIATGKTIVQQSMEFVRFKETPEKGVIVDEGWATSTVPLSA